MNADTGEKQTVDLAIVAIIPTYNNARTIGEVINGIKKFLAEIIVVNDGSTDNTAEIVKQCDNIEIISFSQNRGKGSALGAGFEKATELGFSHAITIDGDGQHLTDDIPLFLEKVKAEPATLWVGNRILAYEKGEQPPARSSFGRRFGNFWYRFNTGIRLHDTQCGFRAYPLKEIKLLKCKGSRYEYELEVLIKAAWSGVQVKELPIRLYYYSAGKTVSHFRPVHDFIRISRVNAKAALTRIFLPFITLDVPGATWREKILALAKHELKTNTTPKKAAASVSVGVFMGIFPIHGFQVATLMGLSFLFKLNRPLAFLGVCVSSPPFLPFLIIAAVAIGRVVLPSGIITISGQKATELVAQGAAEFVVGSAILSVIASVATYLITRPMFKRIAEIRRLKKQGPQ